MVDKTELSFFKRFLKNNGLWGVFKKDVRISEKCHKMPFHQFIKYEENTQRILMDCVLWRASSFGNWEHVYMQYGKFFSENYEDYKKNYFSIKKEKL